jgi:16S rRNA (guanine527-N7)-methyltransferase
MQDYIDGFYGSTRPAVRRRPGCCRGPVRRQWNVQFEDVLNQILPGDLPRREFVARKAAEHLELIVEANRYLNLTRITSAREAAIKHVLDSVIPWRLFAGARHVLDAGTGAGFPGIPLALVLPETRFTLAESIRKKARFLDSALAKLELPNVTVMPLRAEEIWRDCDVIAARALAPISRALGLFAPALKAGRKILLYKGPDADQEIAEAAKEVGKLGAKPEVVMRYDLPDAMGTRTIVQIT